MVTLPQSWYKFDGVLELVGHRRALVLALGCAYAASAASFAGLYVYYRGITTEETLVSDRYAVDGYECRPLTPDPEYGLQITYDECMSLHYTPPSEGGLVEVGSYTAAYTDGLEDLFTYSGPWNFTAYRGITPLVFSMGTLTEYHKPLSGLTDRVYTFNDQCHVPYYLNAEKKSDYRKGVTAFESMRFALDETSKQGADYNTAYPPFGFSNRDENFTQSEFGNDEHWRSLTFFMPASRDFTSECGAGIFSASMQADLQANGTFVFPRVFGKTLTWFGPYYNDTTFFIKMSTRSIGITPLYPKTTTLKAHEWTQTSGLSRHDADSFFGLTFRCKAYERALAVAAYEFIYSHDNCHPCDSFKHAAPFFCVKRVKKTVAEAFSLAVSNTMAILGVIIAAVPILFVSRKTSTDVAPDSSLNM